jgi:hypothetical protein
MDWLGPQTPILKNLLVARIRQFANFQFRAPPLGQYVHKKSHRTQMNHRAKTDNNSRYAFIIG